MQERTLIILKPDCVLRGLCGKVMQRFEARGLKVVAMKMKRLEDGILQEHYSHLRDRPFFPALRDFMKSAPVVIAVLEGAECVKLVREMCGPTNARNAPSGTIRGDFSLSTQCNIIHASDSLETAKKEIARFFSKEEICEYERINEGALNTKEERV